MMFLAMSYACSSAYTVSGQGSESQIDASFPKDSDAIPLLRELWTFAANRIYPTELAGRFDSETLAGIEATLSASDDLALADAFNPFLESLGVSHTRLYDLRHQTYYLLRSIFSTREIDRPRVYTIGVQLDDTEGSLVNAVFDGSPAMTAGMRNGDRIVAVDGEPFDSLLQWQQSDPIAITVSSNGEEHTVRLTPVRQSFHRALHEATVQSTREYQCNDERIGYMHLWAGTNDEFLNTLIQGVSHAKDSGVSAFILDLRDGFGGAWFPYLDPFFADRSGYFVAVHYRRNGPSEPERAPPLINSNAWLGPMVVITNGGTRSGKEAIAHTFKRTGRATLIGTPTAGALMGGLGAFADRDDGYLFYLATQETRLDEMTIEGIGVSPDIVVPDGEDYEAPIAAALRHLGC